MSVAIHVQFDQDAFGKVMAKWKDQTAYALSTAINKTAIDAQSAIRDQLASEFVLRNNYAKQLIKIKPFAKKATPTATIKVEPPTGKPDILSMHEQGGEKVNQAGGRLAIPDRYVRPTPPSRISQSKLPRNLKHAFVMTMKKSGKTFIMTRTGRGGKNLRIAYQLIPDAHVKADLNFVKTAIRTIHARWRENCEAAWNKAIATASPPEASETAQ